MSSVFDKEADMNGSTWVVCSVSLTGTDTYWLLSCVSPSLAVSAWEEAEGSETKVLLIVSLISSDVCIGVNVLLRQLD